MLKFLLRILPRKSSSSGFTLLELLAVVIIAGVLASIAAATFQGLLNTTRINNSRSRLFSAIKDAQSRARRDKISYQLSIRRNPAGAGEIQIAVHNARFPSGANLGQPRNDVNNWNWQPILANIRDSQRVTVGATFLNPDYFNSEQRIICVRFDPQGRLISGDGCISLNNYLVVRGRQGTGPNQELRCIRATSLLGAITSFRQGQGACNVPGPNNSL